MSTDHPPSEIDPTRSPGIASDKHLSTDAITTVQVSSVAQRDAFIALPFRIYKDDPAWRAPLLFERRDFLNPKKNPLFDHCEVALFLVMRGERVVGRISAQIDALVQKHMGPGTGQFGMFECEDDEDACHALFNVAHQWLRTREMTRVLGPFNLSINEETGLLIDGFETPPFFMMPHGRPYYQRLIESVGYQKAVDTFALKLDITSPIPPRTMRMVDWARKNPRIQNRQVDLKNFQREVDIVMDIFNDAWSENWGFIPFTPREIKKITSDLKLLISKGMVEICEYEGQPIAFMATVRDLNSITHGLNGRLFPFGWARFLKRLKLDKPARVRVPLMGVKQAHQNTRHGAAIAYLLIESIRENTSRMGGQFAELSWILESNRSMLSMLESIGCQIYRTQRVFERTL